MWRLYGARAASLRPLLPSASTARLALPPACPQGARGLAIDPKFKAALLRFRELNRHSLVPSKFTVPADDDKWPARWAGMRLGKQANRHRQRWRKEQMSTEDEDELREAGFVFDHFEWRWRGRAQPALAIYKEVHGDLLVPQSFVVPSSAPWAEETWGMTLGETVSNIRADGHFLKGKDGAERRAWLDEMGFVWDVLERRWEDTKEGLLTYKEVHGDVTVPFVFVVPSNAPWAEKIWGMKLGHTVQHIRSHDQHLKGKNGAERRAWLDEIGFVWNLERRWEDVKSALTTYKEVHGDVIVPHSFVVPSSAPWAAEIWGMALGETVKGIRLQDQHLKGKDRGERREWLDGVGIHWEKMPSGASKGRGARA